MTMKTNNRKIIKQKYIFYILLIIAALAVIFVIFFLRIRLTSFYFYPILVFTITVLLISVKNLFQLKYFDYEHSGEVVSIKYYSLFKTGKILPTIEVPRQKIISYCIQKKGKNEKLILSIKGRNEGNKKFGFRLIGISSKKIEETLNTK